MESVTLQASRRERLGTKHTRRARQQGKTPAIVYGHGQKPEPIALVEHEVELALQHHSRLVKVDIEGKKEDLLIKAVQYDHLGTTPIHMDLVRVNMDERVKVEVQIELRGEAKGSHDGGVLHQLINAIEVECPVVSIPESFRPSVSHLEVGGALLVKDLELPAGVTTPVDPEEKIAICNVPAAAAETEETEGEEGGAEPEVITRAKEESDES